MFYLVLCLMYKSITDNFIEQYKRSNRLFCLINTVRSKFSEYLYYFKCTLTGNIPVFIVSLSLLCRINLKKNYLLDNIRDIVILVDHLHCITFPATVFQSCCFFLCSNFGLYRCKIALSILKNQDNEIFNYE